MKIISNINTVNFASSSRKRYYDRELKREYYSNYEERSSKAKLLYSNYTIFFRDDMSPYSGENNWYDFRKIVASKFKKVPKVNVYNFASSDGSEAYSFIISMIEELGEEKSKKFFPVKACDVDEAIIREAKSGRVLAGVSDLQNISKNIRRDVSYYFSVCKNTRTPDKRLPYDLHPKNFVFDKVKFKKGDFLTELDKIKYKNSLILCRNFWPYLSVDQRTAALNKLAMLDDSSLVVVGGFDISRANLDYDMRVAGFVPIYPRIYQKR